MFAVKVLGKIIAIPMILVMTVFVLYRDHFFKNLWFGSYGIQSCYYAMCDYCPYITAVE